jgi:hypothetical protein
MTEPTLTTRTFFIQCWNDEKPKFRRMIAALPAERLDYRPHRRSNSAAGLAWQIAEEFRVLAETIDTGELRWAGGTIPGTLDAFWPSGITPLREWTGPS